MAMLSARVHVNAVLVHHSQHSLEKHSEDSSCMTYSLYTCYAVQSHAEASCNYAHLELTLTQVFLRAVEAGYAAHLAGETEPEATLSVEQAKFFAWRLLDHGEATWWQSVPWNQQPLPTSAQRSQQQVSTPQ
jgi:hypothetical protein